MQTLFIVDMQRRAGRASLYVDLWRQEAELHEWGNVHLRCGFFAVQRNVYGVVAL